MMSEGDLLVGEREIIDLSVGAGNLEPATDVIDVDALQDTTLLQPQQNDQELPASNENDAHEERKKRRRMMRRMLKPGAKPSFVALVTPHVEEEDDEEEEEEEAPKRIRIDVDEYLGLKKKKPFPDPVPSSVVSSAALPADEGWFEGSLPMSLPGESFLPELQQLIRSNLELFSATDADVNTPQPGRRTRTVRGKVGIRCIHCAKAVRENPSLPWPSASVSYPINILGIYPSCSQKPQLHFQNCPHMPADIKDHLHRLMFDEEGSPRARQRKTMPGMSSEKSMSAAMYYTIAAKMIGIVDVPGGMRFGRDLALEPLPLETVRAQIEDTKEPYKRSTVYAQAKPAPVLSTEPRITADVESERVLAQAVAEKDNDLLLAKSEDKQLVTDHIFLCIKQMAICHATESDFATRGKKTKMMRLGFAGFCCRHCAHFKAEDGVVHYVDYSCRSFSSAADNLASAISNSFYLHVQKCPATPLPIRNALSAYKRIHSRQMSQMPYGSQRRMFQIVWTRLRAADLSKEQMEEKMKNMPPPPHAAFSLLADSSAAEGAASVPDSVSSSISLDPTGLRGPMPVCDDEETKAVLKKAGENWDPAVNDSLVLPTDRSLVSDYVFLMMRQLKAAHPTQVDFSRGKRTTVSDPTQPGLKCIHCMDQAQTHAFKTAVGRSFPSAPDNMASTLNSSMYQHVQKCPCTPEDVKRALANLKRIHSAQCASLRFGSQRRFFNLVFQRLKDAPNDEPEDEDEVDPALEEQSTVPSPTTTEVDDAMLVACGFVETRDGCFECQHCRMVPFALRARDSIAIGRPRSDFVQGHQRVCKKDAFDLHSASAALQICIEKYPGLGGGAILSTSAFHSLLRAAVGGNEELCKTLLEGLTKAMVESQEAIAGDNQQDSSNELRGLSNKFPSSVDSEKVTGAFKEFAGGFPEMEPDLLKESHFLRFLQIVSPSLVIVPAGTSGETHDTLAEESISS